MRNTEKCLQNPRTTECKHPAFHSVSFQKICIGMNHTGTTKWTSISKTAQSLRDLFKHGIYRQTSKGKSAWKSLISGASLQTHCYREGFNVKSGSGSIFARIGIVADNDYDCYYPNSYIGLGTKWSHSNTCPSGHPGVSCGNLALCWPDNGDKSLPAYGYIYVQ